MSERKYLFKKENKFYKANLHCHTTVSDGKCTPKEIKDSYMAAGYSIVAFSDHEIMQPHPELESEDFVPVTATEISINKPGTEWPVTQTYHINFYAKDKNATTYPEQEKGPYERVYGVEGVNRLLSKVSDAGFLCQINHPRWSMQSYDAIEGLRGVTSFEIFNTGCEFELFNGDGEYEYELYLRTGGRGAVAACDDNHLPSQQFGGWTMVSAPSLTYDNVMTAIENGDTYASTGPVIEELYIEDGRLYVRCSPVAKIGLFTEGRMASTKFSHDGSDDFTFECFSLDFPHKYFRLVLVDEKGKKAWTRAYFDI